jgi:hypothetical protein
MTESVGIAGANDCGAKYGRMAQTMLIGLKPDDNENWAFLESIVPHRLLPGE